MSLPEVGQRIRHKYAPYDPGIVTSIRVRAGLKPITAVTEDGRQFYAHEDQWEPAPAYLTAGVLRAALAAVPDDTPVAVLTDEGYVHAVECLPQSSDAVPGPAGTDPVSESTILMFLIDPKESS